MGQIIIESPNATLDWFLYEIDLKHNAGGHYVNVDSWILPKPGPPHHAPPSCVPSKGARLTSGSLRLISS